MHADWRMNWTMPVPIGSPAKEPEPQLAEPVPDWRAMFNDPTVRDALLRQIAAAFGVPLHTLLGPSEPEPVREARAADARERQVRAASFWRVMSFGSIWAEPPTEPGVYAAVWKPENHGPIEVEVTVVKPVPDWTPPNGHMLAWSRVRFSGRAEARDAGAMFDWRDACDCPDRDHVAPIRPEELPGAVA